MENVSKTLIIASAILYSNNEHLLSKIKENDLKSTLKEKSDDGVTLPEDITKIMKYLEASQNYNISFEYGTNKKMIDKVYID